MKKKPHTNWFFDLVMLADAMSLNVVYAADSPNIVDFLTDDPDRWWDA